MTTLLPENPADEVVSLSAGQVARLLDALELHGEMLQIGHEDARRIALQALRPGYLLDFDLLFRYMFRAEERPDWAQELQYLFDHEEATFLIGPGTKLEIDQFMENTGFTMAADGTPVNRKRRWPRQRRDYGLDDTTMSLGIYRLNQLLAQPNVKLWDSMTEPDIDEEAFETAKAALDIRRAGPGQVEANRSDALNWAAVLGLRKHTGVSDVTFHPYLLTSTKPLLNEKAWSRDVVGPVSRSPTEAIYVEVLLETFPNASAAVKHTIDVAWKASSLQHDLRQSDAYMNPEEHQDDPEFERAIDQNLVTNELRSKLAALSDFITDPVITRTQRIYDNATLAAASITQQRGTVGPALTHSPRKLFDLIVEVNAALGARSEASGLADLWNKTLELAVHAHPSRTTYELLDRGANRRPLQYLIVEHYGAQQDIDAQEGASEHHPDQSHFVLRWPSSLDAEEVLDLFCDAFARHDAKTVELTVGTDSGIEHFGAELPITLKQLMDAIADGDRTRQDSDTLAQLFWIRMGSPNFDLYADVAPPGLATEPVLGVFVERLNPDHLRDLYRQTSARYLFPAWLQRAIEAIAEATG